MASWLLALAVLAPSTARAHLHPRDGAGSLVTVSVDVEGQPTPLYRAPDGSGRYYLEARPRSRYALRLANNTHQRLGVVITVDGLNAISGEQVAALPGRRGPNGRMYVLDPWASVTVQGWRTSLDEVRRFTFVDEQRSYAARSGQANARMGWIELAVYRERQPVSPDVSGLRRGREIPPPPAEGRDEAEDRETPTADGAGESARPGAAAPRSYPGTGWGPRTDDHATLVDFDPQPQPGERITLRYEYASGLRALGIDVRPWWTARDRLRERDRGEGGFAKAPAW
jgi:hypothetical protein